MGSQCSKAVLIQILQVVQVKVKNCPKQDIFKLFDLPVLVSNFHCCLIFKMLLGLKLK